MQTQSLKAEKRKILGRKVKQLRHEGVLPANIYGKKIKSQAIQVNAADFAKVYKETGETGLVKLVITGEKGQVLTTKSQGSAKQVLIHNVQTDPVTDLAVHADFLQVDLKAKVTAQVPIELIGTSPAEKEGKGTVVQYIDEIEVEALPTDLLDKFEIDLSKLSEVDKAVKVGELKVDRKKIEIKNEADQLIVKVEPPRKEEEEIKPEVEEEVVEVEGEEKKGEEVPSEEKEKVDAKAKGKETERDEKKEEALKPQ